MKLNKDFIVEFELLNSRFSIRLDGRDRDEVRDKLNKLILDRVHVIQIRQEDSCFNEFSELINGLLDKMLEGSRK